MDLLAQFWRNDDHFLVGNCRITTGDASHPRSVAKLKPAAGLAASQPIMRDNRPLTCQNPTPNGGQTTFSTFGRRSAEAGGAIVGKAPLVVLDDQTRAVFRGAQRRQDGDEALVALILQITD